MATVTEPIALDRSLNTTEQTPRNLADVLAQALQALNTTISGLNFINCVVVQTLPTTDISTTTIYLVPKNPAQTDNLYDEYINLTGTSAGWEKIGDTEIDLSNYYNKTETDTLLSGKVDKVNGKGLSTNDYTTAEKTKLAGIEAGAEVNPTSGVKTATESFETVDGGLLSKCMIDLVPVQSGSGDPYPAGGGKNKLPMTVSGIKNANSGATWSDNSCTINGVTWTINTDSGGNVIDISANGTASANSNLQIITPNTTFDATGMTLNGCPSGGGTNYYIRIQKSDNTYVTDGGSGVVVNSTIKSIWVAVANGNTANNLVFKPMLRLSTETDPTFAPYSNVRPISGHTEVDLQTAGKNLLRVTASSTTPYTVNDDGTILANGTSYGINLIIGYVYPNGSTQYKLNGCPSGGGDSTYRLDARLVSTNALISGSEDKGSGSTFTASEPFYIALRSPNTVVMSNVLFKPMVRLATDTDSTFEPYLGHLYQVQIGSTVYGGYVDLVSGVMIVDRAITTANDFTPVAGTSAGGLNWADCNLSNLLNTPSLMLSSHVPYSNSGWTSTTPCFSSTETRLRVYFEMGTWGDYSDMQIVYPLATPITIQLTPQQVETLAGQNNLSTPLSGQSIETNGVEYKELFTFADVKKVLDTVGAENITSEFTKSSDCTWENNYTRIVKWGRRIDFYLRFTTPSTISSDKLIITVPDKYKPSGIFHTTFIMGSANKLWDGASSGIIGYQSTAGGLVLIANGWSAGTNVGFYGSYYI